MRRSTGKTEKVPFDKDPEDFFNDLEMVESSLRSSLKIRGYFENPRINFTDKINLLKKLFKDYIGQQAYDFIYVMVRSNSLNSLTEMLRNYKRTREDIGLLEFEVRTAVPLSPEEKANLAERFSAKLKRPLTIRNIIDPEIIAGMVIKAGDIMIDASVSAKMKKLAKQLRQV